MIPHPLFSLAAERTFHEASIEKKKKLGECRRVGQPSISPSVRQAPITGKDVLANNSFRIYVHVSQGGKRETGDRRQETERERERETGT